MNRTNIFSLRKLAGCMGALALVLAGLVLWAAFDFGYLPTRSFDAEKWREAEQASGYPRLSMVDDLIESGQLNDRSRTDVLTLLGPPTNTNYFSDWDAVYWLGRERGFIRLDSEWLVVRFDEDERVSEYRLVRD